MKINRNWLADTLALMSFTIVTGMFVEIVVVGMTLQQSLFSRLFCQPVNILTGRMYGAYRDWIINLFCRSKQTFLRESFGDVTAFLTFQLPMYIVILIVIGIEQQAIVTASISQTASLLILGAPYGQWLKLVRRKLATDVLVPVSIS